MAINLESDLNYPTMPRDRNGVAIEAFAPKEQNGALAVSTGPGNVQSLEIDNNGRTRLIRIATKAAPGVDVAALVEFASDSADTSAVGTEAMLIPANSVEYFKFSGYNFVVFKATDSSNITVQVSVMD